MLFKKIFKQNSFSIFIFHGVIKKNNYGIRNYNKKHILEKDFYKFVKKIKKEADVLSVEDIVKGVYSKDYRKKKKCLITFDDGFENNYSIASPILDDLKIPATFYFSTDFIENNTMSWIDKIEYCIENTSKEELKIPFYKKKISIKSPEEKIKLLDYFRKKIKNNLNFDLDHFVSLLFNECKMREIKSLNTEIDKKINWKQVNKLLKNKLFTIGGHSHQHLSFGSMNSFELKYQINKSLNLFKKRINHNIKHYSYPEGQKIDFNEKISNYLKTRGILCCPSAISGFNYKKTNLFKLKRIPIV